MFEVTDAGLAGVRLLRPTVRRDPRGLFVKTVHRDFFNSHGMSADFAEQYYSVSEQNVVRGLHFQIPPHDHYKLVTCVEGEIRDVAVDLRRGSPTYGQHVAIEMSGVRGDCVYIPSGFAHGFAVRSTRALVLYNVSTVYAPTHDTGIRWDSIGIDWGLAAPLISDRDAALPTFSSFDSPF